MEEFLKRYFGYTNDFVGVAATLAVAFAVFFAIIFAVSVKLFNFQKR